MLKDRKEDLEDRSHFIGGSDARVIMGGDEAALIALWQIIHKDRLWIKY